MTRREFAAATEAVRSARVFVASTPEASGADLNTLGLLVSEVVTNAVLHANPPSWWTSNGSTTFFASACAIRARNSGSAIPRTHRRIRPRFEHHPHARVALGRRVRWPILWQTSLVRDTAGHSRVAIRDSGLPLPGTKECMSAKDAARTRIRVGCSGWDYRDWNGAVYPSSLAKSDWFATYATWFDTVEINNTFYRLPERETVERWAEQAPRKNSLVYSIKMGQFGSHRMKLRERETLAPQHLDRIERLGRSRGPTLVQLPPRWRRNVGRLDEFLAATPPGSRWAIEVRDPSWLHDDTYAVLHDHGDATAPRSASMISYRIIPGS